MTYRPPPVRPSSRVLTALRNCGRRRQAQAFLIGIAALCAAASANATPGTVAAKQAQAQQVLAQIQQIDESMGAAVEQYNLANVRLAKIETDQRENRKQLKVTKANLKLAQASLAARLVTAYTTSQDDTTLSLLLGSHQLRGSAEQARGRQFDLPAGREHRAAGGVFQGGGPAASR